MSYLESFLDELEKISYLDNKDLKRQSYGKAGLSGRAQPKDIMPELSDSAGSKYAPKEIQKLQKKPTYMSSPKYSGSPSSSKPKIPGSIV